MKSAFKRSLAMLLTVLMVLSACTLTLQMAVFAVSVSEDNQPCDCGTEYHSKEAPVAPTCSEWGYTWNNCSKCNKKWATDMVAPTGAHEYTVNKSVAATCTTAGSVGFFCKHCDKPSPDNKTTEALGHNFAFDVTDQDCLTSGKVVVKCLNGCEEYKKGVETTLPATGHNHKLVEEGVKAPTCTEEGYITYSCEYCKDEDYTFAVFFDALGHLANDKKIDPDCLNVGYEVGGVCVRPNVDNFGQATTGTCGCVLDASKVIDALGHDWKALTGAANSKKPTCSEAGFQKYECVRKGCDETKTQELAALPHEWGTATDKGYEPKKVDPVCKPGASTDGYTELTCKLCKETTKIDWIPATHNYEIDPGQEIRYTFAAAVKDDKGNMIIKLDEKGEKTYYTVPSVKCAAGLRCTGCDDCEVYVSDNTTFPGDAADANNWIVVVWVVQKAPSCGVKGILVHSCKDCEFTESLHIPSTHTKGAVIKVVPADCVNDGYTVYECTTCGTPGGFKDDYVANKGGHLWENGVRLGFDKNGKPIVKKLAAQAATCTEPGRAAVDFCYDPDCELNKNKGIAETPALGHDFTCDGKNCNTCLYYFEATCAHLGYWVKGACHNGCGTLNPALTEEQKSFETAAKLGLVDADSKKPAHVWDTVNPFTPGKDATCSEEGRTDVIRCVNCGGFKGGDYLPKLSHTNDVAHFDATCQSPSMNVTYCAHCAPLTAEGKLDFDPAAYIKNPDSYIAAMGAHHTPVVTLTGETADNGGHWILGLPADAREWDATIDLGGGVFGAYRYDLSAVEGTHIIPGFTDLNNDSVPDYDAVQYPGQYVEGSCSSAYIQHHNAYYICGHCGELIEFSVIRTHGWKNGVSGAASCTSAQKCLDCSEVLHNALGHKYVETVVPPTCTSKGYTEKVCSECGDTKRENEQKALDHDYISVVVKPTCTERGYTSHDCSRCDSSYTDNYKRAAGHKWGDPANCTEAQICTVCKEANPAAPALKHEWDRLETGKTLADIKFIQTVNEIILVTDPATGAVTVTLKPTDIEMSRVADCLLYGYDVYECKYCGALKGDNFEAAHGHDYEHKVVAKDCINNGKEWDECKVCGHITNETILTATGYHTNDGTEKGKIELTCSWLTGKTEAERTCKVCKQTFKVEDFHNLNKEPIVTATCTEYGVKIYYCMLCDYKHILNGENDIVPPLGHNPVLDTEKSIAPTLVTPGKNFYKCGRCGIAMDELTVTVPALGGVIVSANTANGWVADAKIVNNGILAYTISIEALKAEFYSLNVDVTFNNKHFTYIGFDLGADGKNIFGDMNFNFGTKVGTGKVDGDYTTLGFYGINENTAAGAKEDVKLEGKQEFVTVYFRVNGDVHTNEDPKAAVVVPSTITLGNIVCLTAADDATTTDDDVTTAINDAAVIEIHKLGNLSGEGLVGPEDLAAIREHVIAKTYDARADINVDGVVTMEDIRLLTQVKVYSLDYADLATKVEPFSVA